jgi:hypothetical protein
VQSIRGVTVWLTGLPSVKIRAEAISAWAVTLYGALLPFHALGTLEARRWTYLEPCEVPLVVLGPAVLIEIWRVRHRLIRSPLALGVAALAGLGVLAELLSARASRGALVSELSAVLAVGGIASAVWRGRGRQITLGLLWGGALALAISAVGYASALWANAGPPGAFVFQSQHPVFSGVPRLTGTLGRHAVWLAEYCLMLLTVALAAGERKGPPKLRRGVGIAAGMGLLASFSFAWLGGWLLCIYAWCERRARLGARSVATRRVGVALMLVPYAAASWWLVVGAPVDALAAAQPRPCQTVDGAHHVARRGPTPGDCQPILSASPYPHRLTLYALAHRTAWERWRDQPVLGGGRSAYGGFARAYAARVHSLGEAGYYKKPVGLYAATLAYTGLAGVAALGLLLFGVWRSPRGWLFFGTLALLLTATHTDLELRGPLWVLLGLLLAEPELGPVAGAEGK